MNSNIDALQTIVTALQTNDYVTSVTPVTKDGETVGYTITFTKSDPITIYHGTDGKDGADGKDSDFVPTIGVKQDTDGIYYWTLDGEWLLDENGNKIKAQGTDGKDGIDGADGKDGINGADGKDGIDGNDGQDGADGTDGVDGENGADGKDGVDGITPQLKIENDYWYISYDSGSTWTQLGKATGEDGKDGIDGANGADGMDGKDGYSFFQSVTQDEQFVYFTLADGTVITLPKGAALDITFAESDLVVMSPNSTREIDYTVTSVTESVKVEVTSSADIKAKVVADDESGLTGKIHITTGDAIDEYSKVIVFVSNGDKVIMRSITFEEAGLIVEEDVVLYGIAEGCVMHLEFLSNVECEVVIPEEAQSWFSVIPTTRAMKKQIITFKFEPNEGYYRSTTVTIQSSDGTLKLEYQVEQDGVLGVNIDPTQIPDNEIWYTLAYGSPEVLDINCFNANIISHFKDKKYGIYRIVFDAPLTSIAPRGLWENPFSLVCLPSSLKEIGTETFSSVQEVYLNSKELSVVSDSPYQKNPFLNCLNLRQIHGPFSSEDGRCLVINECLYGFAPSEMTEYVIPEGVKYISSAAFYNVKLKSIIISEGVELIEGDAFGCDLSSSDLEYLYLPSTLKQIGYLAFSKSIGKLNRFSGNCPLIYDDNLCLIDNKKFLCFVGGSGLTEYTIPSEVEFIQNYAFFYIESLKSLHFPESIKEIGPAAFEGTHIESISGTNVTTDSRSLIVDNSLVFIANGKMYEYTTPSNVEYINNGVFRDSYDMKDCVVTDNIKMYEGTYMFELCPNLQTITISANMQNLGMTPFSARENPKLNKVYCRAITPPVVSHCNPENLNGEYSFNDLTIYVPEESLEAYLGSPDWAPYRGYIKGYNYTDLPENDTYISTDYSQDGVVTTLQTATKGNGIDIVLMGDAYSDRQIADGTYRTDMEYIYNNLFTEEPYKSFKDHFNVHYVNVVSATEGYEYGNTALDSYFGDGTLVGGNDNAVFNYALNAISEEEMDEALIIVAMNSDNYAGTCYMYYPESVSGTYGSGPSVAYFPRSGDAETFAQLLHHEACGHGFAKLADEYAYEYMGAVSSDYVSQITSQQNDWGWWKNVDFTSDTSAIRWSNFINDARYANEGLGAFEGGLTYWSGVWRPTENSIMRYNTGGFNAPSREAIYYRIHKLAYGDSWEYDYEEFVEWDAINRTAAAAAKRKSTKPATYKPTHAPIIVNKSWRDAK